jgi:hypothetical protein
MRSIVHLVSIIVWPRFTLEAAVYAPPARAAIATHGAQTAAEMDPAASNALGSVRAFREENPR